MKFWDASALIPLLIDEATTQAMWQLSSAERYLLISFITPIEITSALTRRVRTHELTAAQMDFANKRLPELQRFWLMIDDLPAISRIALELLRTHPLRAGDAIQLASAITASGDRTTIPFVTLDKRLAVAAAAEGFPVLPQRSA